METLVDIRQTSDCLPGGRSTCSKRRLAWLVFRSILAPLGCVVLFGSRLVVNDCFTAIIVVTVVFFMPLERPGDRVFGAEPPMATLVIDFGDGFEKRYTQLKTEESGTVESMLKQASRHPRGIKFESSGSGATAFLRSIDGVKNEGQGRNWVFRINGDLGVSSMGRAKVKAGDVVRWTFGKYASP